MALLFSSVAKHQILFVCVKEMRYELSSQLTQ